MVYVVPSEGLIKTKDYNFRTNFRKIEVKSLGSVWGEALQNWRSEDMIFIDQLMAEMTDYHLSNTKLIKVEEGYFTLILHRSIFGFIQ
ncbi:hypothetical protein [Bartonella sp. HY761]|uniref:hypothetical protein n=1 Tax=Bartonella sp. HY761 TaxID=2979330 RepID=UPI002202C71A|nr:hypothetical protein [Bartonella sp. HY761]UXN07561.1 hypothetical protein N6A79_06130 [Bartonella sp. HY761]